MFCYPLSRDLSCLFLLVAATPRCASRGMIPFSASTFLSSCSTGVLFGCKLVPFSGSCALCVMSESSSGEDAQTTPPSSCRGSENGEGISSSDEVISAHPAFQQQ